MKYQPMLSVAGSPFEPIGLPLHSRAIAECIAEGRARSFRCRTEWYIEEVPDASPDTSVLAGPVDTLAD